MNELSGLEQLREMMATNARPSIGRTLDFRLVEIGDGLAVFEGTPDERTYNPMGTVHGGYAATLLDSACGIATHSRLAPGQGYTTLAPARAFAEAKLTDNDGRLLASASSTLLITTP